jgi:hypothetical protein
MTEWGVCKASLSEDRRAFSKLYLCPTWIAFLCNQAYDILNQVGKPRNLDHLAG